MSKRKFPRGISTIADLRLRSIIDPLTHCWHWQGAVSSCGTPRIHTVDCATGRKTTLAGPKAVWNIAHGEAPPAWSPFVFRACVCRDCVNPAHLRTAKNRAEIGRHIALNGARKGTAVEQRRANLKFAMAAAGIVPTPAHLVLTIRAASPSVTSTALADELGMRLSTVSRIRRGESHRQLLPNAERVAA